MASLRAPGNAPYARRASGFSLLELVVCIIIVSVLAAVLLNRLAYYQELAEKAAMESMLRTIKTGLQIRLAELIVTNRQSQAGQLVTEDPFRWLDDKQPNYGGRYRAPPDAGAWYFDAGTRELAYVVQTGDRLEFVGGGKARELRFRALLLKDKVRTTGIEVESVTGITLIPARRYRWQ
jgi:general secretion pathway protein G